MPSTDPDSAIRGTQHPNPDMNAIVGSHDLLLVTLDTLRFDVAEELAAAGRIPHLARHLPGGAWEKRHAPGSFTYASHQAIFAGFLPTPAAPGPHPRLFAARFAGSESTADGTFVHESPDLLSGLAEVGYRTVCIGGVGFFNRRPRSVRCFPPCSRRATGSRSSASPLRRPSRRRSRAPNRWSRNSRPRSACSSSSTCRPFTSPTGSTRPAPPPAAGDSRATHAAALEYVDRHIGRLFAAASSRRRCFAIVCSDHGTAYGDDGYTGHRIGHEAVWTVPYAHFFLEQGASR